MKKSLLVVIFLSLCIFSSSSRAYVTTRMFMDDSRVTEEFKMFWDGIWQGVFLGKCRDEKTASGKNTILHAEKVSIREHRRN